ncbi:HWE histidine kinase domain-containing protein [Rhizobium sp. S152]|uniref:GAF domain-containing protein n=1 Tax=Rhizobium sp. S152 TaxID=3055038 RepID=UPI0025AA1B8A|nr:GAF domain-containing protein [Rhizobium sp. S152]MDM9627071.1 HWE histidine kinase domain-containing protein [Rhizobium sp. S152]
MSITTEKNAPDDAERLAALESLSILDSEPEPEFDDIVFLAATICHTPVSLVSLVGAERQWFKARIGFESCDTPLTQSVCAHAMKSNDILEIPDLRLDDRTRDNTLVTGAPHILFYAGAPLVLSDGVAVGSLCVIDTVPRPQGLDSDQRRALRALAKQVVQLLEARRTSLRKDALFRRQKQISSSMRANADTSVAAQEAGRIGTFEIDVATGEMKVSAEFCRIFDVPEHGTYDAAVFERMTHPEDIKLRSTDESRKDGSAPTETEYRIVTGHGVRWVKRNATFQYDAAGDPVRMIGAVQDVTISKRATARVQALLDLGDRLRNLEDTESMAIAAADLMAKALDATRAGFGVVNMMDETVDMQPEWCAPGVVSLVGKHRFRDYGSFINNLKIGETVVIGDVTTDPRTSENAAQLLALGIRVLVNVPILDHGSFSLVVFVHHDHPYEWLEEEVAFVRSFGDRIQSAIARLQAEADQKLVNSEISHRLKNTFAIIQAITTQTLRPVTERVHVTNLERRLQALSRAHDILLLDNWSSAAVASIVEGAAEGLSVSNRVNVDGPDIALGARGTLSLSLIIHELLTNAVKYGALSGPTGHVDVRWHVEGQGPQAVFHFDWKETGGPAQNAEPERKGFGSKLIGMGLIGAGGVVTNYDQSGFSATMSASLDQLQRAN